MTGPGITFRSPSEVAADGTIRRCAYLDAEPEATSEGAHLAAVSLKQAAAGEKKRGPSADRVGRLLR
jgi:hypothetical protein